MPPMTRGRMGFIVDKTAFLNVIFSKVCVGQLGLLVYRYMVKMEQQVLFKYTKLVW